MRHRVLFLIVAFLAPAIAGTAVADDRAATTVAVIGTGDMGDSLGPRLAGLGFRVVYGSRDPGSEHVAQLVAATGAKASAATSREAAAAADIVILAVPWPAMETVARNLGNLDGKIVIDISMPFAQGDDGYPEHLLPTSSAQMIQQWNPGARVVKTFATMGSQIIDDPGEAGGIVSIPVASDDKAAKEAVARIIADLQLDPVDFGPLRMARQIENLQLIYMIPLVQNRPENWEFYFRRSTHYGCYWADGYMSDVASPPFDAETLAAFPDDRAQPPACE